MNLFLKSSLNRFNKLIQADKKIMLYAAIVSSVLLSACGGKSTTDQQKNEAVAEKPPVIEQQTELSEHPGLPVYNQHCLPCHQADGNGVPGMFPPLDKKWIDGDDAALISIVVHGMDEEIEVNGEIYNTIMAPLPHLKDQEVADVLNYIRLKFGTSQEKISTEQVKTVRNSDV